MKKWTLFAVGVGLASYGAYGKIRFGQSPSSFFLEKGMRAIGYKDQVRVADPENFGDSFEQRADIDTFPTKVVRVSDLRKYEVEGMQVFDWNHRVDPQKVIVYFHGGGYVNRASVLHYMMVDRIAKKSGARVVFPTYGLGPRHTVDTQLPRLAALYHRLLDEVGAENLILMGDSAGGGLVFSVLQVLQEEGSALPSQVIALSPWVNLAMDHPKTPFYDAVEPMLSLAGAHRAAQCWLAPGMSVRDPLVSPVNLTPEQVGFFPKTTLFVGSHEFFLPDIRDFHELLISGGVDSTLIVEPRMIHVYPVFPTAEGRRAVHQIAELVSS